MRGIAVQGMNEAATDVQPDEAARKRVAVELIRDHDRPLKWTARRYSICTEDAEDAYQRGIEILLSKAPTADVRQLLPWTRTVIKHEALAIRKTRERTLGRPGAPPDEDHADEDWVQLIPYTGDGPDELAVRRERVARSREALSLLKPAEMKALTQLAEGFSYQEIGDMNEWTRTKVNRCLAEGRARFRSAFRESESGDRCPEFEPLISACCDGEISSSQIADLENHLAACGHCRSTLRTYRAAPGAAAALAPTLPGAHGVWERFQELMVNFQLKLQELGRGPDSNVQGFLASGGTRGAGAAALGKFAAICAGTAGTAAVCAATGVLPSAGLIRHIPEGRSEARAIEKQSAEVRPAPMTFSEPIVPATAEVAHPAGDRDSESSAETVLEPVEESPPPVQEVATPPPTATESEFTPEAAGTVVSTPAPPPAQTSSPIPTSNGGTEFAP